MKKRFMSTILTLLFVCSLEKIASAAGEIHKAAPNGRELNQPKRHIGNLAKNGRLPIIHKGKKNMEEQISHALDSNAEVKMFWRSLPASVSGFTLHPFTWSDDYSSYWNSEQASSPLLGHSTQSPAEVISDEAVQYANRPRMVLHSSEEEALDRFLLELTAKDVSKPAEKRNIAHLARKGWLTDLRSYKPSPPNKNYFPRGFGYNWKREMLPFHKFVNLEDTDTSTEKEFAGDRIECNEKDLKNNDIDEPTSLHKRNIAVLARAGKLPRWHSSANWWELKRDNYIVPLHRFSRVVPNYQFSSKHQLAELQKQTRRCKPLSDNENNNLVPLHWHQEKDGLKQNVAMSARKELIPVNNGT
ncbi:uncharacterized protein LOC143254303 [Tachypleus tridentatus]|uniref:uncharacterized protein LOC143254303 n=1 Tax=Tachypleus tridentatus TaxID=6853 RepID=UPI003FD60D01